MKDPLRDYWRKVVMVRDLIEMLCLDGYTLKDIASILGVSYRTVLNWRSGRSNPPRTKIDYYIEVLTKVREGSLPVINLAYSYQDVVLRSEINSSFVFDGYDRIPLTRRIRKQLRYAGGTVLRRIMRVVYGDVQFLTKALSNLTNYAGILGITNKAVLEYAGRILRKLFKEGKLNRREKAEYYPLIALRIALLYHGLAKKYPIKPSEFGLDTKKYERYFAEISKETLAYEK